MRFSILLAGIVATVCAAPVKERRATQATGEPLRITNININDVTAGNTTVSFNVYDPDPLTNATATCAATWKHNTDGYPKETYTLCGKTLFAWNMYQFRSIKNFTLGLEHEFKDPSVGDPPYDYVTNFARAIVGPMSLQCQNGYDKVTCQQNNDTIIYAPVYATIA